MTWSTTTTAPPAAWQSPKNDAAAPFFTRHAPHLTCCCRGGVPGRGKIMLRKAAFAFSVANLVVCPSYPKQSVPLHCVEWLVNKIFELSNRSVPLECALEWKSPTLLAPLPQRAKMLDACRVPRVSPACLSPELLWVVSWKVAGIGVTFSHVPIKSSTGWLFLMCTLVWFTPIWDVPPSWLGSRWQQ